MNKKYTVPLHIPVLWFAIAGLWTANLCVNLYNGKEPEMLDIVVICTSLICAVYNLIRYIKDKKAEKKK